MACLTNTNAFATCLSAVTNALGTFIRRKGTHGTRAVREMSLHQPKNNTRTSATATPGARGRCRASAERQALGEFEKLSAVKWIGSILVRLRLHELGHGGVRKYPGVDVS